MHLFRLLKPDPQESLTWVTLIIALSAISNAALIGLINHVAEQIAFGEAVGVRLMLLYLAIAVFHVFSSRVSMREANAIMQDRLDRLRQRVIGKVRNTPLRNLEQIGHGDLFAVVAQEVNHLSHNLPLFVGAAQSVFLLLFVMCYIAILSLPSFLVLAGCFGLGAYLFLQRRRKLNDELARIHGYEARMLDSMASFVDGFQEIRLHADKNDGLYRHLGGVLDGLEKAVLGVGSRWVSLLQFSNAFIYALVGVVIFVLPIFFEGYTDTIYKIAAAITFCIGPIMTITGVSHLYARAETGLAHVHRLERMLDKAAIAPPNRIEASRFANFQEIRFEEIRFSYLDRDGEPLFSTGPWNLTLKRGETLFLTGGNGSGKTTAMKLISQLYVPDTGRVLVDGIPIDEDNRQEYRELFSAVFADFHLFDRLYGLDEVTVESVGSELDRMELGDKVRFDQDRFSTLDLSTGQRKRLAMIVAMLEDREIYLFDEWAADQDRHFRAAFYEQILPDLKRRGKTVLCVTHDDRFWDHCDRRVELNLGVIETPEPRAWP